jgi:hypothetical protein
VVAAHNLADFGATHNDLRHIQGCAPALRKLRHYLWQREKILVQEGNEK